MCIIAHQFSLTKDIYNLNKFYTRQEIQTKLTDMMDSISSLPEKTSHLPQLLSACKHALPHQRGFACRLSLHLPIMICSVIPHFYSEQQLLNNQEIIPT